MAKHRDSNNLDYSVKVSVDKKTYEKIGKESAARGISMAAVLRDAYSKHLDAMICSNCIKCDGCKILDPDKCWRGA